jgi:hypothetical protein
MLPMMTGRNHRGGGADSNSSFISIPSQWGGYGYAVKMRPDGPALSGL